MSFPRYPAYKDSGVDWLGEVPEHWEIKSIRYILDAIGDVDHFMPESVEKGVPYLMTGDLKEFVSDVSLDACKQVSLNDYVELSKRIKSSKGDVIMARYATIGTSMYVDIDVDFLVSYSCVTLKTNHSKVSGLYLFQYMKSDAFRQGVENQVNTNTQGNVGIKDLQNVKIAVAPIDEQPAIAAFLDRETAKIDALVAEQRRLMALLKEKRQAVISHAVTRGLNPDAPMKSSGIEWLGVVPEHWDAPYFGLLIDTADLGGNFESSESGDGIPLIKMGNLDRGFIKTNKVERLPAEIEYDTAFILNHGDFLFNTRNSLDLVGKVAIWRDEIPVAIYNSNILRISFKKQKVGPSEYMSYFFNSDLGLSQLRLVAKGTTSVAAIYYKDLTTIRVVLPPIIVQYSIVDYLDDACAKLDTLTTEAQRAIDLLQERRTALISAAVTGQIDVRAAAA